MSKSDQVIGATEVTHVQCKVKTVANISPKQPSARRHRDWYPYYAGFTERFVNAVIQDYLDGCRSVVDPWSGSGTTTVTSLRCGMESSGVDINPATTVIARARLNPKSTRHRLLHIARSLVEEAQALRPFQDTDDLLDLWMAGDGVGEIRALRRAIREILDVPGGQCHPEDPLGSEGLSNLACFFYTACFGVARSLLAKYGTTNPMWIKRPRTARSRIRPGRHAVCERFLQQVACLASRLTLTEAQAEQRVSPFKTGSAADTKYPRCSFDAAITSPPYATRVDYVRGTLPELAVLGADEEYIEQLRSACTGSPKIKDVAPCCALIQTSSASELLSAIERHPSKGSQSYYHPWMANYLRSLQDGLLETDRVVSLDGVICVVVQDSYYKEIHVDMQKIVAEILAGTGRVVVARHDYPAPNPRRQHLSHHPSHTAKRPSIESLLVFRGSAAT